MKFTLKEYNLLYGMVRRAYREMQDTMRGYQERRREFIKENNEYDEWPEKEGYELVRDQLDELRALNDKFEEVEF